MREVGVRVGLPRHDMKVEGVGCGSGTPRPLLHMQCSGACPKKTRPPSCFTSTSILAAVTTLKKKMNTRVNVDCFQAVHFFSHNKSMKDQELVRTVYPMSHYRHGYGKLN